MIRFKQRRNYDAGTMMSLVIVGILFATVFIYGIIDTVGNLF